MDYLKVLRVAIRILMDVNNVLEKKESDFEVGCKCKDVDTAKSLQKMLAIALEDCPVSVIIKEETIVVVLPESTQPSSPLASSPQCLLAQTPQLPSLPGPLVQECSSSQD